MTLLLTLALIAADPLADLVADINAARVLNGVLPVARDERLDRAAGLQVEWLSYAAKRKIPTGDHVCNTAWLLANHPDLDWWKLLATYGTLPDWLGAHDLGRLCGYDGLARDIGAYVRKNGDPVVGWLRSDGHRSILLGEWKDVGVASAGVGGGKFAVWACFGSSTD